MARPTRVGRPRWIMGSGTWEYRVEWSDLPIKGGANKEGAPSAIKAPVIGVVIKRKLALNNYY